MSDENNNGAQTPAVIDAACRMPVLLLFGSALAWLVLALVLGFLATMNFHMPALLADCPWFTYGHRVSGAHAAFLFGFGGNAALGITIWMLSRLRGLSLRCPCMATLGGALWNIGATAGLVGVMRGDGTGYEGIDIPVYSIRILILGGGLIAASAVLTYFARRQQQLYVSTWYLMAGLVVLPWVLVTIYLTLGVEPVRGVAQASVHLWALASLNHIWLGAVGLATLFYFVPKILDTPLYSRQLAGFGFWSLLMLGGWLGLHAGAPMPVWMIKIGHFAGVMFIFPLLAVYWNIHRTIGGRSFTNSRDLTLSFLGFAYCSYLLAGVFTVIQPYINSVTHFTLFNTALSQLFQFGFFAMAVIGAIYFIVPRLVGADWEHRKWLKASFNLGMAGVVLYVVPLLFGGWSQGQAMANLAADDAYNNLPSAALMTIRIATVGEVLLIASALLAFINFNRLVLTNCCGCCNPLEIIKMMRAAREEGGTE